MKKIFYIIIGMSILCLLTGCTGEVKPDITELGERMGAVNEKYAFTYFDTFIYEGAAHTYISLSSEDDVLLTIGADDEGKIDRLTITSHISNLTDAAQRNELSTFCTAAVQCSTVMSEKEYTDCLEALSFDNPEAFFTDLFENFTCQRYIFTFSSNSEYISLDIEYSEIIKAEKNPTES